MIQDFLQGINLESSCGEKEEEKLKEEGRGPFKKDPRPALARQHLDRHSDEEDIQHSSHRCVVDADQWELLALEQSRIFCIDDTLHGIPLTPGQRRRRTFQHCDQKSHGEGVRLCCHRFVGHFNQ